METDILLALYKECSECTIITENNNVSVKLISFFGDTYELVETTEAGQFQWQLSKFGRILNYDEILTVYAMTNLERQLLEKI